jgi:hypothetical protein
MPYDDETEDDEIEDDVIEDEDIVSLDTPLGDRDRDGVASLHDVEAEAGDEIGLDDLFDIDETEARELDADIDGDKGDESLLN